jgi:hypothetical protein
MRATCNDETGYASRLQMPVATSNLNETIILTAATDEQDNDQQCGRLPMNRQETGHNTRRQTSPTQLTKIHSRGT